MGEFDLIRQFFQPGGRHAQPPSSHHAGGGLDAKTQIVQGIGDDCAIVQPRAGLQWAISSDMLVEGRHFLPDCDPYRLGHKALAVNLSDLAAAGAEPLGFTLALALPAADPAWLAPFSEGLLALAARHGCPLLGGDTTKGPLTLSITVFGQVPAGQALLRSGARVGDDIYVSGTVGEARLALDVQLGRVSIDHPTLRQRLIDRIEMPQPRLALGQALRGIATAAIDLSDGLMGDLGHILRASGAGAQVVADAVRKTSPIWHDAPLARWSLERQNFYGLSGGDDYELAFTAPPSAREQIRHAAQQSQTPVHRIGKIVAGQGIELRDASGNILPDAIRSFDHFSE